MDSEISVYGTDWCGDTVRTRRLLDQKGIDYKYINIDEDSDGEQKVIAFSNGKRRVPLVEFSTDGEPKSMAVPTDHQLSAELETMAVTGEKA